MIIFTIVVTKIDKYGVEITIAFNGRKGKENGLCRSWIRVGEVLLYFSVLYKHIFLPLYKVHNVAVNYSVEL